MHHDDEDDEKAHTTNKETIEKTMAAKAANLIPKGTLELTAEQTFSL